MWNIGYFDHGFLRVKQTASDALNVLKLVYKTVFSVVRNSK